MRLHTLWPKSCRTNFSFDIKYQYFESNFKQKYLTSTLGHLRLLGPLLREQGDHGRALVHRQLRDRPASHEILLELSLQAVVQLLKESLLCTYYARCIFCFILM
jgi:hypothetical protein